LFETLVQFYSMKKALVLIILAAMVANFLVPRFSLSRQDSFTLTQIIKTQSTLLYFFSLTTLPMKMVNDLFHRSQSAPLTSQDKQDGKPHNASDTSADFTILSANKTVASERNDLGSAWVPFALAEGIELVAGRLYKLFGTAQGSGVPLICMLMFFFLRPRSAIDDIIFSYTNNKTQLIN